MTAVVDIGSLISSVPQMHGGKPCIAGTGVTVLTMVELFEAGLDPRQIQAQYPELSLEGILAALAYATANRQEIDDWFAVDAAAHSELLRLKDA
jgi:uncharacterized protein (DUF433 family)